MPVLLIEDHGIVREGFRMLLESMQRFDRIIEAGTLAEALATCSALAGALDLIIVDLGLPDAAGLEALDRLNEAYPRIPLLVVSGASCLETVRAALTRGAKGYVPKNASGVALREAIERALRGKSYVPSGLPSPATAAAERAPGADAARLTRRQEDVLRLLASGLANKEIAVALNMSPATVRVHVTAILKELGVENRTQAAISPEARRLSAGRPKVRS
jgi:DNA-binding NarL/FixJ family response regulator